MQYKNVGRSGLKVSVICLGTWRLVRDPRGELDGMGFLKVDDEESMKMISYAIDRGVNFIDTANRYHGTVRDTPPSHVGYSEKVVGKAIQGRRDELVIATKVAGRMGHGVNDEGLSRIHVMSAVRASLERLGTDRIDLYQAHKPDESTPIEETLRAFTDLVRQGKVSYIGCSNFSATQLSEALLTSEKHDLEKFICVQDRYNLLQREIEGDVLPLVSQKKLGLLAYSPLAQGFLTGKYGKGEPPKRGTRFDEFEDLKGRFFTERNFAIIQGLMEIAEGKGTTLAQLSLAWLLSSPLVTSVIVGATSKGELEETLGASDLRLTKSDMERVNELLVAE